MFKPFSIAFFVLCMVWFGAIFVTSDPQQRMDRACMPVEYMDKAATSGMQLLDAGWGASTHRIFEEVHYGCRFVIWRMFYEDDWSKAGATLEDQGQSERSNEARHPHLDGVARRNSATNAGK